MKKFKAVMSPNPRKSGRYYICSRPSNEIASSSYSERLELAEESFREEIVGIIENSLLLQKSTRRQGTVETIELYETINGIIVEVVQDQFDGLMVESEDKEIIEKIYKELLKE